MNKKRFCKKGRLLVAAGCCCIAAALSLFAYNAWVSARAARESGELLSLLKSSAGAASGKAGAADPALEAGGASDAGKVAAEGVGGYDIIGTLRADAIRIRLPVISAWSYRNLQVAPCRYSGTPETRMVLLAHNYAEHFGRLNDLKEGDDVTFTDVGGKVFRYRVIRTERVPGDDRSRILAGNDWNLTLFTCTYSGAERVVVRCRRC